MENTKVIKTIEELFEYLTRTIKAECFSTKIQWEQFFVIVIVTSVRDVYFKLEYFEDTKKRGMYLYDCHYYTEEQLVQIMLEEVSLVVKIK